MNTSTSLFAKALATENIFVSFDSNAKTATFDVASRTLIIPDWKVSNILRDMIVAHEVAHALFTPAKELLSAMDAARGRKLHADGYKACINVIEDARIERSIKEKFPGCRRDFYAGYKEILDTDLFQLKSLNMDDLTIIDKVNLHFKFGLFGLMNISLNAAEQAFIDRVAATKSFDEVVALADELYAMQEAEDKQQGRCRLSGGVGNGTGDLTDAMQGVQKDGDLEKAHKVSNLRYEDFPHLSYPLPKCDSSKAIITYDDLLKDCRTAMRNAERHYANPTYNEQSAFVESIKNNHNDLEQFRKESANTVRELVAQFERRKAAEEIRKERMKPTGTINPDRLHQFKTHDDIFLRNLVKHEGKKHGMVMLIDWSGSMNDCVDGVVRQLLTLTWFCRKAKIPFEVFLYTESGGFTDPDLQEKHRVTKYEDRFSALYGAAYAKTLMANGQNLNLSDIALRQVLSSSMNDAELLEMEQVLWRYAGSMNRNDFHSGHYLMNSTAQSMQMHGTPSCEALMAIYDFLPKFRAATGSQIVDFIHITDGDPTGLGRSGHSAYIPVKSVRVQHLPSGRTLTVAADRRGYIRSLNSDIQYFLVDEIRKLGCVTVGFSIGPMSGIGSHLLSKFVRPAQMINDPVQRTAFDKQDKVYNDYYKKENFLPADTTMTPGFDEYYIVRPVKPLGVEMDEATNATNSTLTKIRNQFLKSLNSRKVSRVFLSRFIDLIAGRKVSKFKFMG